MKFSRSNLSRCFAVIVTCLATSSQALAQPTYSVDVQGPTFASGSASGADILTPVGAGIVPPPAIAIPAGALGVGPTAVGFDELDALSYGRDPFLQNKPQIFHDWSFSVDEFAVGQPGVPFPSVTTEGAFTPIGEASADIYASLTPPGPVPIAIGGNTGIFDGNGGATPFLAPGLNLIEPNPPAPFATDAGDNLDAWDIDTPPPTVTAGTVLTTPVYFSLDSHIPDPLESSPPFNTGSALANGFVGGDVLITTAAGGPPALYASASSLGLDLKGTDTDDLDALVLWDNGDGVYQPTDGPYSWMFGTDMLLYSVRRGSALIGTIDTLLGAPIEEGDILVPFAFSTPGIFIPAEALGLATVRSNGVTDTFQGFGDDLNALDVLEFVVPEPATLMLACMGLVGMFSARRRRSSSACLMS